MPKKKATCALSPSSDNCYLAYPSPAPQSSSPFAFPAQAPATTFPARSGDVVIFDALALRPVNVIEAHKSPLSAVAFNSDGTLLATASDKGTVVRVFSVPTATKLYQFRRGTYPSQIFSMNFNMGSTLLAVSSATETVHIFRLARPGNIQATQYDTHPESVVVTKHDDDPDPSLLPRLATRTAAVTELDAVAATKPPRIGIAHTPLAPGTAVASILRTGSRRLGKQVAGAAATYLPAAVAELWQPQRDFAYVRAPKNGSATKTVVGFSKDSMRLYTVTGDGYFCQYGIDLARGGECAMLQQYSLFDNSET